MSEDIEHLFGRRLRELRDLKRLTQAQLGEKCGVSTKYLGAVERGEQNPTLRVLAKLAAGLEVDLAELVRLGHQADPDVLRAELTAKVKAATEEDLRRLVQLVNVLVP